jgi:hypothetical protein
MTTLREIRDASASRSYRKLNRQRLFGSSLTQRTSAANELSAGAKERFGQEGFASRISMTERVVTAFTALGAEILFSNIPPGIVGEMARAAPTLLPFVGPVAEKLGDVLGQAFDGFDWADKMLRRRRSPFLTYFHDPVVDIYGELKRAFPALRFEAEDLAGELAARRSAIAPPALPASP